MAPYFIANSPRSGPDTTATARPPVAWTTQANAAPRGVLCRAAVDHEGTPLVQFSPPLVFTREDIDTLVTRVRTVFDLSAARLKMAG